MFSPARRQEIIRGQFLNDSGVGIAGATVWVWVQWSNANGDVDKLRLKCGPTDAKGGYAMALDVPADSKLSVLSVQVQGQTISQTGTDGIVVG